MKRIPSFISASIFAFLLIACSGGSADTYDSRLCSDLAVKIDSRQQLDQSDYTKMIEQNEAILIYIINRTKEINELPDSARYDAWRNLLADPQYLERFGYMFTIGSELYQAHQQGLLDKNNQELYARLDRYNADLADLTDRN